MNLSDRRSQEIARYSEAYRNPGYRMGPERLEVARKALEEINQPWAHTVLDVGAGRGEVLALAEGVIGFAWARGVECVDQLVGDKVVKGLAWSLPFPAKWYCVVTCFDVLEHLLPVDAALSVAELGRVARDRIILTISNVESLGPDGKDLHVNRRPYEEWDRDLQDWLPGFVVTWRKDLATSISEAWVCVRRVL